MTSLPLLQWSRGTTDRKDLKHEKSTAPAHAHLNHAAVVCFFFHSCANSSLHLRYSQYNFRSSSALRPQPHFICITRTNWLVDLLSGRKTVNRKWFVTTLSLLKPPQLLQQIFSRQPMSLLSLLMLLTLSALPKTAIKLVPFSLLKEHIYQLWKLWLNSL